MRALDEFRQRERGGDAHRASHRNQDQNLSQNHRRTEDREAPSAMRTPISLVRRATVYDHPV